MYTLLAPVRVARERQYTDVHMTITSNSLFLFIFYLIRPAISVQSLGDPLKGLPQDGGHGHHYAQEEHERHLLLNTGRLPSIAASTAGNSAPT